MPSSCRVIVVDDQADTRDFMRLALEAHGFQVCGYAANGQEGVEVAREHQPHVVVLDYHMPVMNGLDALPKILAAAPHAKVVMWSSDDSIGEEARARGARAFHTKRVSPVAMVEIVLELCRESQTAERGGGDG